MPKTERGLPAGFDLNVAAQPVELGDYLDEAPPTRAPLPAAIPAVKTLEPLPEPVREPVVASSAATSSAARPTGPPRKQFNMTPETLRMVDDLLVHLRTYSAERDVRASELFHALVLAVHEVRPFLDLSRIPPRGKWGSASAAALPVALKEAFQDAITRYKERH